MGKYEPLARRLVASNGDVVSMTFEEITDVLGSPLANSGRTYQAFWSNPTVALPLARSGFRARPRLGEGRIEFIRIAAEGTPTSTSRPTVTPIGHAQPDFVFVGCVKTKLTGRHKAQDIYRSTLFLGRRRYAELRAVPWFILSAKHGLLAPDDEIDSYDVALGDLTPEERQEWGLRVLSAIDQRLGPLDGKTVEVHAGAEYRDYGLRRGLEARGARVVVPLEGVDFGNQLAWYQTSVGVAGPHPEAPTTAAQADVPESARRAHRSTYSRVLRRSAGPIAATRCPDSRMGCDARVCRRQAAPRERRESGRCSDLSDPRRSDGSSAGRGTALE